MDANEVLANAKDIKYTIETTLDNTLVNEYGYYDWFAGDCVPFGGSSCLDIDYKSNAIVRISNAQPLHGASDEIAVEGLTLTQALSGSFDSSLETTFGTARLINTRTDDEYSLRSWKDRPYEVKIGGTLYCGTDQETTLEYDQYVTWFNGRIDDFTVNNQSIDLSLSALDSEFNAPFPPNTDSSGVTIPYILGSVNGFKPKSEGEGLFKFHDGDVETSDEVMDKLSSLGGAGGSTTQLFDLFPSISIGNNRDYYHDLSIGMIDGFKTDGSGTLIQQSSFDYQKINDQLVDETNDTHEFQVDDSLGLEVRGDTVVVTNANPVRSSYNYNDFSWIEQGNGYKASRGLPITVETTGDIIGGDTGGGWFTIRANGSGTVTINFPENVTSIGKMVIRNVNSAYHTITNFSTEPDSITPPIPATSVINHALVFSEFNDNVLSFDFSANTVDQFVKIWFEDIKIIDPAVGAVRINFDNQTNDIDLDITTSNSSQSVIQNSITPNSIDGFSRAYSVLVEIGSGEMVFSLNSFRQTSDQFGVFYSSNDNIISISPPPPTVDGLDVAIGVRAQLPSLGAMDGSETRWTVKVRARLASTDITSVLATIATERLVVKKVTLTQDWQEFQVTVLGGVYDMFGGGGFDSIRPNLMFGVWRGDLFGLYGIEVDYIRAYPNEDNSEQIKTYVTDGGVRSEIRTYRVDDARRYKGKLPREVALYDDKGYVCVSPDYTTIIGDFNGSSKDLSLLDAVREISLLSTGKDSIDTNLTSTPLIGHAMDTQKPAIEHIQDLIGTSDYFYQDNLADSNITLKKRYSGSSYPSDFMIDRRDIREGSVSRTGSENREQQYIVEYQRDYSDSTLSKTAKSSFAGNSKLDTRRIVTSLRNEDDAQEVADLIDRDSSENGIYRSSLIGVGLDIEPDSAGVQQHPDIPKSRPSIVRSKVQNTSTRETQITSKVLTE